MLVNLGKDIQSLTLIFLHERWLDINDESSDQISDSDSTD